jgi:uncharacterized protein YndB with AHSA1/START domain
MADIEVTTVVKASVKQVFNLVSEIPNYTNWVTPNSLMFIESRVTPAGPVGLGTTFEDKLTMGKTIGKVVEFDPFKRVVFEQKWYPESHVTEMRVEYNFEPVNGDTKINHKFDVTPVGIFEPLKPTVTELCREERIRTCEAIKTTLERKS